MRVVILDAIEENENINSVRGPILFWNLGGLANV